MKNLVKFSLVVGCILVTGKVVEKVASKKLKEKVEDINKETDEFNEKIEEDLDKVKEIKNLDDKIDALIDMVQYYQKRNEEYARYFNIEFITLRILLKIVFYGLLSMILYSNLYDLKIEIANIVKEAK